MKRSFFMLPFLLDGPAYFEFAKIPGTEDFTANFIKLPSAEPMTKAAVEPAVWQAVPNVFITSKHCYFIGSELDPWYTQIFRSSVLNPVCFEPLIDLLKVERAGQKFCASPDEKLIYVLFGKYDNGQVSPLIEVIDVEDGSVFVHPHQFQGPLTGKDYQVYMFSETELLLAVEDEKILFFCINL